MPRKPKDLSNNVIQIPTPKQIVQQNIPVPESALQRVYRECGITQEEVNAQPRLTETFAMFDGGMDVAIEYLRGSTDTDAIKFIEIWDRVHYKDREILGYEGLCAAAKVSGKKLYGMIVAEATVNSEQTVALVTALMTPEAIKNIYEQAKFPQGHRERKLIAQASGWLPRPKGSQTNIQINTANVNRGTEQSMQLPSFNDDIRELGDRFQAMNQAREAKLLEGK